MPVEHDPPPHLGREHVQIKTENEPRGSWATYFSQPLRNTTAMNTLFSPTQCESERHPATPTRASVSRANWPMDPGPLGDPDLSDDEGGDDCRWPPGGPKRSSNGNGRQPARRSHGSPGGGPPDDGSGPSGSAQADTRHAGHPNTFEAHFDFKLKPEIVPTWNGDTESLARWILWPSGNPSLPNLH